jgi:hypothetical protein
VKISEIYNGDKSTDSKIKKKTEILEPFGQALFSMWPEEGFYKRF